MGRDEDVGTREGKSTSPSPRPPVPQSPGLGSPWDDMVVVGRVARPHGLRGHVVINPDTDFVEIRFAPGSAMWTRADGDDEVLTVAASRIQGGRPVVAFEGVTRVEDAERLAGRELRVPEAALQPLQAGTFYEHQLVGCAVETVSGDAVGTVSRVEGGVGGSRLIVDGARGEIQIPLAIEICTAVDVAAKRIRIEPPPGLLELNEK